MKCEKLESRKVEQPNMHGSLQECVSVCVRVCTLNWFVLQVNNGELEE